MLNFLRISLSEAETATGLIFALEFLNLVMPPCYGAVLPMIVPPDVQHLLELIKSIYLEEPGMQLCHLLVHAAG